MSSVLVIVIVGVMIAAIAGASIRDDPKPATPDSPRRREEPVEELVPAFAPTASPSPPSSAPQHLRIDPMERLAPSAAQRLRAVLGLGLTIVVLGTLAAAVIGGSLFIGMRVLDQALG